MNAGLHELPLIFFTVLAQSAVGAFLVFTFVLLQSQNDKSRCYIYRVMFVVLVLLGLGFVASILHLGSPLRAFNSLNRVGESMLSNEIASGAIFFVLAVLYWLISVLDKMPVALGKLWLIVTSVVGLVFMYMMAHVYFLATVPTWHTPLTPLAFYLTVVVGGLALGYALLEPNSAKNYHLSWVKGLYAIGVLLIAICVVYQGISLGRIHSSVQQATALVPDYAPMMVLRLCLLGIAAVLLVKSKNAAVLLLAVVLTFTGELIGRTLFYGLHITAGMAVGS
ncbi:dimethyl sulfoxide reductase anchor subunit family protein [Actinobacillus seminis]|uniref:dimethyl sulfoxide reductase anchor subunit family protein n=1 Tax=Actinobacillus seminis TaxID=722 RepID=UPI003B92D5B0